MKKIRKFPGGATRDQNSTKKDFTGFLSPIVLDKFADYMHANRFQKDGSVRAPNNWKKHFGEQHFDVCLESLMRHVFDLWLAHEGFPSREGKESAINGILFNTFAYADKYYKDQLANQDRGSDYCQQ